LYGPMGGDDTEILKDGGDPLEEPPLGNHG
jgi:hypothetical protein